MNELIRKLSHMKTSQLQAIYNEAWRKRHNEIEPEKHHIALQAIEFVCGANAIGISGEGGSFELAEQKDDLHER